VSTVIGQSTSASGLITGDLEAHITGAGERERVVLEDTNTGEGIVLARKEAEHLRDWLTEMLA
jgi:hypothetical protein